MGNRLVAPQNTEPPSQRVIRQHVYTTTRTQVFLGALLNAVTSGHHLNVHQLVNGSHSVVSHWNVTRPRKGVKL